MHLQERRQLRLFLRRDAYGRFMSCMVYLPRDRYTTQVRHAMEAILLEAFDGVSIDYTALVSESVLARLHFVVRVDPDRGLPDVDPAQVEAELVLATRSWDDDFADALRDSCGAGEAARLAAVYADAFPEAYKEDLPAADAVADLHRLEKLTTEGDIDLKLYLPADAEPGDRRLKLYHVGMPVSLSQVLPALQDMGVEVVDERPYEIDRSGRAVGLGLRLRAALRAVRRAARRRRPDPVRGRLRRRLGGRGRERRLQRAGAAGRADLAAGDGAAGLRQVPAPGRHHVQPALHRGVPHLQHPPRAAAGGAVRGAVRPVPQRARRGRLRGAGRRAEGGDRGRAGRRREPGPGPHPAVVPRHHPGHPAHQLLPGGVERAAEVVRRVQARPAPGARPARPAAAVRDLGLQPAGRGRAPAVRPGRPRWAALVRPAGGLPHRGARPGQGADGEERRHRPGRRQGRLRRQASTGRPHRPRGGAGRGHRLLPHLHQRAARRHRQPGHRRRRPGGRAAAAGRPARRRRHLPGGGRGQGHRHLLRHRQPGVARLRVLARRRVRLRRVGRLRPQGDGHHRARRLGVGQAALPRAGHRHPVRGLHRGRHRRHVRRRVRQRDAAVGAHPAARRVRPPARVPRPGPRRRDVVRRAAPPVRPAPLVLGRLRPVPDLGGWRRLPAHRQVDPDLGRRSGSASGSRRASGRSPRPS